MGFPITRIEHDGRRLGTIVQEVGVAASHWMPYVAVDDVDAACARARELGGAVRVPPTDIPKLGRFAVVADPHGAAFSPVRRPDGATAPAPGRHRFAYATLATPDLDGAAAFYGALLGWSTEKHELAGHPFVRLALGGDELGVLIEQRLPHRPAWLSYLAVDDVAASLKRAFRLGADVTVPPRPAAGNGTFAILRDPVGAAIAVWDQRAPAST